MRHRCLVLISCALLVGEGEAWAKPDEGRLTADAVNGAAFAPLPDQPAKQPSPLIIRAEVLLDRARFSPGAIDGMDGENFRKAVAAYQAQIGLPASGILDHATWDKLVGADSAPAVVTRKITAADAKGPYVKRIPAKMEAQAKLPRMAYRTLAEKMAEQVHASPGLLKALNPGTALKAGVEIAEPQVVVDRGAAAKVGRIVVDKTGRSVKAFGADGKLLAFYPASIGSTEKPAPSGSFTVLHVTHNPDYTYNPQYAFKGVKTKKPFRIAPGPNSPVGSVWIDLSDPGYGIHGTPEPERIGKTESHGCIRLTNWDVEDLASMVPKNTPVEFPDAPGAAPATAQQTPSAATGAPDAVSPSLPPASAPPPMPSAPKG